MTSSDRPWRATELLALIAEAVEKEASLGPAEPLVLNARPEPPRRAVRGLRRLLLARRADRRTRDAWR